MGQLWATTETKPKSYVICSPDKRSVVQQHLQGFDFKYVDGHHYLGGYLGPNETEFHSRHNNETSNLLAFALDVQTHKTTIKLKIAANRELMKCF